MTNQFLIQYARDQFGFPPYAITEGIIRAARAAWNAQQQANNEETSQ